MAPHRYKGVGGYVVIWYQLHLLSRFGIARYIGITRAHCDSDTTSSLSRLNVGPQHSKGRHVKKKKKHQRSPYPTPPKRKTLHQKPYTPRHTTKPPKIFSNAKQSPQSSRTQNHPNLQTKALSTKRPNKTTQLQTPNIHHPFKIP